MAKGQKRSNREIKKPKKPAAERAKTGVVAAFSPPPGTTPKSPARKK